MRDSVIPMAIGLMGSASLLFKLALTRAGTQEDAPLRRLLKKTYPVPYAIWMAGLAVTLGYPVLLFVWAVDGFGVAKQILFLMVLLPFVGCLIGFYLAQCLRLPWLATFGDTMNFKPRSPEDPAKDQSRQSVLAVITLTTVVITSVALAFGLGLL